MCVGGGGPIAPPPPYVDAVKSRVRGRIEAVDCGAGGGAGVLQSDWNRREDDCRVNPSELEPVLYRVFGDAPKKKLMEQGGLYMPLSRHKWVNTVVRLNQISLKYTDQAAVEQLVYGTLSYS